MILTSQTSTRGQIVGHEARNLDAQRTFLNTFENIVNRRVNIPEDIRRFQKTLQYARSKVDYAIGEFVYMLPSDMNLRIGNVRNYNNKILILSPSFKIGTNLKINLSSSDRRLDGDEEKDKQDVKSKKVEMVKTEPDVKSKVIAKPNIELNEKRKQDVKPNIKFDRESKQDVKKPDLLSSQFNYVEKRSKLNDKITYEEEKVALILGTTAVFTVWWMFS